MAGVFSSNNFEGLIERLHSAMFLGIKRTKAAGKISAKNCQQLHKMAAEDDLFADLKIIKYSIELNRDKSNSIAGNVAGCARYVDECAQSVADCVIALDDKDDSPWQTGVEITNNSTATSNNGIRQGCLHPSDETKFCPKSSPTKRKVHSVIAMPTKKAKNSLVEDTDTFCNLQTNGNISICKSKSPVDLNMECTESDNEDEFSLSKDLIIDEYVLLEHEASDCFIIEEEATTAIPRKETLDFVENACQEAKSTVDFSSNECVTVDKKARKPAQNSSKEDRCLADTDECIIVEKESKFPSVKKKISCFSFETDISNSEDSSSSIFKGGASDTLIMRNNKYSNKEVTSRQNPVNERGTIISLDNGTICSLEESASSLSTQREASISLIQGEAGTSSLKVNETFKNSGNKKANIIYKCSKCRKQFIAIEFLKKHMKKHMKKHENAMDDETLKQFSCKRSDIDSTKKMIMASHICEKFRDLQELQCYMCNICGVKFSDKDTIKGHSHKDDLPTMATFSKCRVCELRFQFYHDMLAHVSYSHGTISVMCPECDRAFRNRRDYATHKKLVHDDETQKCHLCDHTFQRGHLGQHMRFHQREYLYDCKACGEKKVRRFWQEKYKVLYKCNACNAEHVKLPGKDSDNALCAEDSKNTATETQSNDMMNKRSHGDDLPNVTEYSECMECGLRFQFHHDMLAHVKHLHGTMSVRGNRRDTTTHKKFVYGNVSHVTCPVCDQQFQHSHLDRHIQFHQRENLYDCKACGEKKVRLFNQENYKVLYKCIACDAEHTKLPGKDNTFALCVEDSKNTATETQINQTSDNSSSDSTSGHKASNLHKCDFCGKIFQNKQYLDVHLKKRHQKCKVCSQVFADQTVLEMHIESHDARSDSGCPACGGYVGQKDIAMENVSECSLCCAMYSASKPMVINITPIEAPSNDLEASAMQMLPFPRPKSLIASVDDCIIIK